MVRRKRPPVGSKFTLRTFTDPSSWLGGFLHYLDAECGTSKNTLDAYARDLNRFFEWNRQHRRVNLHDIDVQTVTQYLDYLQGLSLAASSIGRNLVSIRMFFRYLMLEGVVAESTVDLVSSPKLWERLPRVLSPEMVDQLLAAPQSPVDRFPLRDRAIFAVLYATGCRVSELVHLRRENLFPGELYCRCTGKGNKQRLVSLNPVAVSALEAYFDSERSVLSTVRATDDDWVFLSRSGRRLSRESVWTLIRRYAARIGCGEISPHTLRHSFATHMLAGGADIRALQEMLGHASIRTTQVYTHVEHSRLKSVHRRCHPRG